MTVENIIQSADKIRPNLINNSNKLEWLYAIEKRIADHMSRYGETDVKAGEITSDSTLLLPKEYKDVYAYYIVCMVDLANQDIAMYNNSCAYFNDMFTSWQKKWRRENIPQKSPTKRGDE